MPVTRKEKEAILSELVKNFQQAKSVVFSQYQGTNVKNMRLLRKKLHEKNTKFKVARKTLMTLAAKKLGFEEIPPSLMEGPIGLAFGMEDEIAPARIIHELGKTVGTVKIVGALFEGKFILAEEAKTIAALPAREALLASLVGLLKSPIAGFHAVLHGLLRNFMFALSEISTKKSQIT